MRAQPAPASFAAFRGFGYGYRFWREAGSCDGAPGPARDDENTR
jgi:hypothetical protein